jgi:hypothetical protein
MPNITFQPVLKDMKDVLKSDFYTIPRFQRPYSWSSENLDDFWRDVVQDNDPGYFIGPMVAYTSGSDLFSIVDGQQRITSITLALCVIRDMFLEMQAKRFASGLEKYIQRDDDDSISHFVLRSEAAGSFLKSQIQTPPPRAFQEAKRDEERALKKAHDEIATWLRQRIEGLAIDHTDGPESSDAAKCLRDIRDKILGLQVIWIQLDSEDDAYIIFETLNSRGKDLETVDLLKNLLLGAIRAENGDLDTARLRWSEMRETLSEDGGDANPNKFILHWWLSQHEYTAERKLFRLIRQKVTKPVAPKTLYSLRRDSALYARIANPSAWQCKSYERPAQSSLQALNLFSVRQPRPLLLSLFRAYEDGQIKVAKLKATLRAIEAYHYISTAVVGVSSTGGLSMMYAAHAREISAAKSDAAIHSSIDTLVRKLKERRSSRETFLSEFSQALYYSSDRPEARRLVQYTLQEIHDFSIQGNAFDHKKCNIEHISSQSDPKPWTSSIGNLLWVDEKLNAQLGNKSFAQKQEILEKKKGTYEIDDVLAAKKWTQREVNARTARLARIAYDEVWRVG